MYCQQCGKELSPGASSCAACGARIFYPPPPPPSADQGDQIVAELKQAAKDLASSAARLSRRLAEKAETVAKDPPGSAKRAARRVSEELDAVTKEVDRILKDL
jgi:zinc ribbon protein